jgi:tetratricopeptide (TPR) repeat protein
MGWLLIAAGRARWRCWTHAAALARRRLRAVQPLAPARTGRATAAAPSPTRRRWWPPTRQRSAADWFNLAFLLERRGPLDEAEAAFRRAVEIDDKLDRAWYGLGLTLIRLGRHDEAVKALERNTKLQPMSPYGWYQLARVHMDRQQPDEALKIIRHLKGFEPKVAAQLERETGLAA